MGAFTLLLPARVPGATPAVTETQASSADQVTVQATTIDPVDFLIVILAIGFCGLLLATIIGVVIWQKFGANKPWPTRDLPPPPPTARSPYPPYGPRVPPHQHPYPHPQQQPPPHPPAEPPHHQQPPGSP